ncbi:MarR family transcriptional regulator [Streptomyces sp. NPDC059382]|uniref:MarR family transcriptional regulator n=1 Tax=Streptomyces sp. NPDC059382 TaxID=3346816 RepID=UPI0036A2A1F6
MTSPAQEWTEIPVTPQLTMQLLKATASRPGADYRVLTYYVNAAPLGDTVRETAKDVSAFLELSQGTVSKSLTRLVADGWMEISYTVARVAQYRAGRMVMELALAEVGQQNQPLAQVHHLPVRTSVEE